jgi:hypothetical protein
VSVGQRLPFGQPAVGAFQRYELKYLVDRTAVPALRATLAHHLELDCHGGPSGYDVCSVYYDSPGLEFYWDRIEGRPFRRKLRVRHYGDGSAVDSDTTVYVEIKVQVDRVTEKRRVPLPYRLALQLCDGREMVKHSAADGGFLAEVLRLVSRLDLRPVTTVGYRREAFVGRGTDRDLRVTLDHRMRGRDWDHRLDADAEDRPIVPPTRCILEIKAIGRIPYWIIDLATRAHLPMVRVSTYGQSVEEFGRAPHSVFHVCDPADARDVAE